MNSYAFNGSIESAFVHMSLLGATSILNETGSDFDSNDATFWWSDEEEPAAHLETSATSEQIGAVIQRHAQRHTDASSWVQARISSGPRAGGGLLTARLKPPALDEWEGYEAERDMFFEKSAGLMTGLDWMMLGGLGRPAWWRCRPKETRPDDGASRWEMKTRNRGEEFIVNRLAILADVVARREPQQIWEGLTGEIVVDEAGKNSSDSRSATGFSTPGPADNARAWCALWGINALPTIHLSNGLSQSPGTFPRNRVHPAWMALPVFTEPVSASRFRSILLTREFDRAFIDGVKKTDHSISEDTTASQQSTDVQSARLWLKQQGITAIMHFPVLKTGSSSAPERQLLTGDIDPL